MAGAVELDLVVLDVDATGAVAFKQGEVDPVTDLGAGNGWALEGEGKGDFDDGFVLGVEDLGRRSQLAGFGAVRMELRTKILFPMSSGM